ncbi:MAG: hypothetical protein ACE5HE_12725, partial [Phycisphaerae bacterium]
MTCARFTASEREQAAVGPGHRDACLALMTSPENVSRSSVGWLFTGAVVGRTRHVLVKGRECPCTSGSPGGRDSLGGVAQGLLAILVWDPST